jgi:phage major head subunit gpT-like protein
MELTSSSMVAFKTLYDTTFNNAFNLAEAQYQKAAYVFNSGRVEVVNHRWLRGFAGMREFIGARVVQNVGSDGFLVKNQKWEFTQSIQRVDLERDQWGVYTPILARQGQQAKLHRDTITFGLLSSALAGTTTYGAITAYDGIALYGNHNTNRTVTFNNKLTGNGSWGSSSALTEGTLTYAIQELRKRRDVAGNVLAAAQSKPLLIVPPDLEFTARKLLNLAWFPSTQPGTGASSATSQGAASQNVLVGVADLLVSPYLLTSTEWHLTLVDAIFKPIIFQIEQELEIFAWDKFLHRWVDYDEYTWGVRALYTVAPGLPEMVFGSVGD